jgi:hypothetical protein
MLSCSSHCTGWCGFRPPFWGGGVRNPQDGPSVVMLTARVPDGPDPAWRSPLIPRQIYPMSELSWRSLVVELLCHAATDGFQYSRTWYQVCVCTCGHVMSYQALNVVASWGPGSSGAYPVLKALGRGCLGPGACVESREMRLTGLTGDKILLVYSYQDKEKDWCGLLLSLVLFRLVEPPLPLGVVEPYLVWGA